MGKSDRYVDVPKLPQTPKPSPEAEWVEKFDRYELRAAIAWLIGMCMAIPLAVLLVFADDPTALRMMRSAAPFLLLSAVIFGYYAMHMLHMLGTRK